MITQTLDEALRRRAREKLTADLNKTFEPVYGLFRIGYRLDAVNDKGEKVYIAKQGETVPINQAAFDCTTALKMSFNAAFAYRVKEAEQEEVNNFLKSVEQLRDSVDELCAELPR